MPFLPLSRTLCSWRGEMIMDDGGSGRKKVGPRVKRNCGEGNPHGIRRCEKGGRRVKPGRFPSPFPKEGIMIGASRKWAVVLGTLWIMLACSSCAFLVAAGVGAGAAVGTMEYVKGEMKQAYAAGMEKTWNASLEAVEILKMKVTEKSIDNLDHNREIHGQTEEKKAFQISLEFLGKDVTMVKVRIGLFGDEAYSRKIHDVIGQNLKK